MCDYRAGFLTAWFSATIAIFLHFYHLNYSFEHVIKLYRKGHMDEVRTNTFLFLLVNV